MPAAALGFVLVSAVAYGWDLEVHKQLTTYALTLAPVSVAKRLDVNRKTLERRVLSGAGYAESFTQRGKMHGELGLQELIRQLEHCHRSHETIPDSELMLRLGMIGHVVADIFAPPRRTRCPLNERFLQNHKIVYGFEAIGSASNAKDLIASWQGQVARLNPRIDLDTLRFDWSLNAILAAWSYAMGAETATQEAAARPILILGRDTNWAPGGFGITREESAQMDYESDMKDAKQARTEAHEEYTKARSRNEDAILHQDGMPGRVKETSASREQAFDRYLQADTNLFKLGMARPVVTSTSKAGETRHAVKLTQWLLEQSMSPRGRSVDIVVRVLNTNKRTMRGLNAILSARGSKRRLATVQLARKPLPPGTLRTFFATAHLKANPPAAGLALLVEPRY